MSVNISSRKGRGYLWLYKLAFIIVSSAEFIEAVHVV